MSKSKHNLSIDQFGNLEKKRKFSLLQWFLGRSREYCPDCNSTEYFYGNDSIVGGSCCVCDYNPTMRRIWNNAMKKNIK